MSDGAIADDAMQNWSAATTEASMGDDDPSSIALFSLWWLPYVLMLILFLLFISVPGNLLTVIACIKFKELRSPAHLLIINQSVGDLISAIAGFNFVTPAFFKFARPKYYCLFTQAFQFIGIETSVLNLMAITIDRFVAVVFTFQYYTWVTSRRVNIGICILWAVTVFVHLLPVMGWNIWRKGLPCQSMYVLPSKFFNIFFVFPVLIALLLTAMANVVIGIIALKKSRRVGDIEDKSKALQAQTQLKVTKMLLMVVGTFYACWMPYIVVDSLIRSPPASWTGDGNSIPPVANLLFLFSQALICLSAFINPLIYAYKDKNYRRAYCKLLGLPHHIPVE